MKDYSKLSRRDAIALALAMAIDRGDEKAAAKFRKALNDEVSPSTRNMRRLVGVLVALAVAFMVLIFVAGFLHADTVGVVQHKPAACLIVVNSAQTTWRYATRAGHGEIVRKWIPFGLKHVKGDCTPPTTRQQP